MSWRAVATADRAASSRAATRSAPLDDTSATVAHALKNLLGGVKALVQLGLRNPRNASSHERLALVAEALQSLVSNAIEASSPGGHVEIEVRTVPDGLEIAVHDTGRGMPPETLRRVGTPYFTTRADGTGLGVALARSAFALHGGTLRYESAPGEGTTVRATLPRAGVSTDGRG